MKIHLQKLEKTSATEYAYKFDTSWIIRKQVRGWVIEKKAGVFCDTYKKVNNLEKAVFEIELYIKNN